MANFDKRDTNLINDNPGIDLQEFKANINTFEANNDPSFDLELELRKVKLYDQLIFLNIQELKYNSHDPSLRNIQTSRII